MLQYILAHGIEILLYIQIGVMKHRQAHTAQSVISKSVTLQTGFIKMLRAVKFDHKFCGCAIEIDNIVTDDLLAVKSNGKRFQKIIPEVAFFFCHFPPQIL